MKTTCNAPSQFLAPSVPLFAALAILSFPAHNLQAGDAPRSKSVSPSPGEQVPLKLTLPSPRFTGTPPNIITNAYTEPYPDPKKPRPAMMVPPGLSNLAFGKKVTCSDKNALADALAKITDGNKEADDDSIVVLRKGTQWVQVDLGGPSEIFAIVIWHAHNSAKVYHDVIVQAADDADFAANVRTVFNNDQDNSAGQGVGTDREYFETFQGKLIDARGVKARYLRFYSTGSTEAVFNEYTEIEAYGRAAEERKAEGRMQNAEKSVVRSP